MYFKEIKIKYNAAIKMFTIGNAYKLKEQSTKVFIV